MQRRFFMMDFRKSFNKSYKSEYTKSINLAIIQNASLKKISYIQRDVQVKRFMVILEHFECIFKEEHFIQML